MWGNGVSHRLVNVTNVTNLWLRYDQDLSVLFTKMMSYRWLAWILNEITKNHKNPIYLKDTSYT